MAAADDAGRRLDDLLETVEARLDHLEASSTSPAWRSPEPESCARELEPSHRRERTTSLLVPAPSGYALVEQGGPLPARGETIELPEREERYAVVKVVHAPSPDDRRPWVYLEAAT